VTVERDAPKPDAGGSGMIGVLLLLFVASGFAALLYQVIWQRLLTLLTGLDLLSVTTIVAAFMLGMGLGSFVGGQLADRLARSRLLAVFAACETGIALYALASVALYRDLLADVVAMPLGPPAMLLVAALALLPPTFCMGLTLPVLARSVTLTVHAAPRRIGALYGWNTVGAALGAWLGSAFLIRRLGYADSLYVGAALNLVAAGATLLLLRQARSAPEDLHRHGPPVAGAAAAGAAASQGLGFRAWVAVYFLSGFVALGLEIVWFRLLGVLLKSTAYTFPYLLSLYLAGVGIGSLAGAGIAAGSRQPRRTFLLLQAAVPAYAMLSVAVMIGALSDSDLAAIQSIRAYLASYEPIAFRFGFAGLSPLQLALYGALPVLLVLPPTLLMGASFPYLQRAVHADLVTLGRRVGRLQAANILGCVVGVIVAGAALLEWLGTAGTLRVLGAAGVVFMLLLARTDGSRKVAAAAVAGAALLAGALALTPGQARLWAALHGAPPERVIHAEDAAGLSVLWNERADFTSPTLVFVNGLGQSWIPFGGIHTVLGLAPVLLHPAPKEIAVIGLGSGDTLYALAARPDTTAIHSIEIVHAQLGTLRELARRTGYDALDGLLNDPRIRFVRGDGRGYIMKGRRRYDIIEADALRPTSAYAGNLYSREYFDMLRAHLQPGGLAVTWEASPRTRETFMAVFPHIVHFPAVLIGSNEPIACDRDAMVARGSHPAVVAHFRRAGIHVAAVARELAAQCRVSRPSALPPPPESINTDAFPRDELGAG
jgi:predicted membrane-bound spermidine synthase